MKSVVRMTSVQKKLSTAGWIDMDINMETYHILGQNVLNIKVHKIMSCRNHTNKRASM